MLTLVKVAEPYRSTHKVSLHSDNALLITRPENIKVQSKFNLASQSSEASRTRGNGQFKDKKYLQALEQY